MVRPADGSVTKVRLQPCCHRTHSRFWDSSTSVGTFSCLPPTEAQEINVALYSAPPDPTHKAMPAVFVRHLSNWGIWPR